ncbi:MAG: hypothetical protein KDC84_00665 [Crocinitomicaceae bacterium]|nr:hypothetical protein [Crocinitomicaceae bacterium]
MSLKEYQYLLTLLLTQKEERNEFLFNRNSYLEKNSCSEETISRLIALDEFQLNEASMGLIRKRWGVAKSLLQINSETAEFLRPLYFQYAENNPIQGKVFKHQIDALNFIESLNGQKISKDLDQHLKNRRKVILEYLKSEGHVPENKPKWKRFLKI